MGVTEAKQRVRPATVHDWVRVDEVRYLHLAAHEEQRVRHEWRGRVLGQPTASLAHAHRHGEQCNDRCEVWDWQPEEVGA